MGPIQSSFMDDAGTSQVTTTRTKFLGVNLVRDAGTVFNKIEIRNGTSGSSAVLFTLAGDHAGHSDSMVLPSGSYILCEDGMHATATGDDIVGVTLIYQAS
jgi:hypothetical protein